MTSALAVYHGDSSYYVFDALDVRLWCKPPGTRLAVPSGELFEEHVARGRTVLL